MDRRQALGQIFKFTGVAMGGAVISPLVLANASQMAPWDGTPLTYVYLDPNVVARKAYTAGYGCMNEVFSALVSALAEAEGPDQEQWQTIPVALARFGYAGVLGEGTVCGNINGAAMFLNMVKVPNFNNDKVVASLMTNISRYYEQTLLPSTDETFLKAALAEDYSESWFTEHIGKPSVAESLLCHASLTRWALENGGKVMADKGPRCTLLSANIAYMIANILNQALLGELDVETLAQPQMSTTACQSCHTPSFSPAMVKTNMECDTCHGSHF